MVIEIEVDTERNGNWHFLPLGRTIRGRMDFAREAHAEAVKVGREDFPKGIPGQRLTLDLDTGKAELVDPILKDESIVKQIKKRNMALPTERETFTVHKDLIPSWLYWLKRGVESGIAKLIRGKLPDKIEGKIQKRFAVPEVKDPSQTRLDKLTALLFAKLTPQEKEAAEQFLAE